MIEQQAQLPVNLEGEEPCSTMSVRFGRHPADANVTINVPKVGAQVNLTLAPAVYMSKDFMENYLHYVCVVTSERELSQEEACEAVIEAAEYLGISHLLPMATAKQDTAELAVLYTNDYPTVEEAKKRGIHIVGLLLVVPVEEEYFKQTVSILKMAGVAAMTAGRLSDRAESNDDESKQQNLGRRLSDAMPPNNSKH